MNVNDLIVKYADAGYDLEINESAMTAKCNRPAPRARLGYKNEFYYQYSNLDRLIEHTAGWIDRVVANKIAREAEKINAKKRRQEMQAKVKVGDIFVDSWGYEQTNVNFYEVVEKPTKATVIVREIAYAGIEGTEGHDCQYVRALPGEFVGEPMKKQINAYGGFKTSSFSSARPTTAEDRHYNSWYY